MGPDHRRHANGTHANTEDNRSGDTRGPTTADTASSTVDTELGETLKQIVGVNDETDRD